MIEKIIEFSARNRFLILIIYLLVAGFGIWSVYNTPVDAIPDQEFILNVKATLNETKEVPNNLTLKLDYPFGFEFISSNPSPEVGNNIWNLTALKPGEEFNVEIKGRMVDVFEGEEKIFHALA